MPDSDRRGSATAVRRRTVDAHRLLVVGIVSLLTVAGCMEESPDLMMGSSGSANPGIAGPPGPPGPSAEAAVTPGDAAPDGTVAGPGAVAEAVTPPTGQETPGPAGPQEGPAAAGGDANSQGAAGGGAVASSGSPVGGDTSALPGGVAAGAASASGAGLPQAPGTPSGNATGGEASSGILDRLFTGSTGATSSSSPPAPVGAPSGTTTLASLPRVLKDQEDKPIHSQADLKKSGKSVKLEGTLECGVCKKSILLNVVSASGLVTCIPGLEPGNFSVLVPKSAGSVILTAIADDNGDGLPTAGEPLGSYGSNPVSIGEQDLTGVSIQIGKAAS